MPFNGKGNSGKSLHFSPFVRYFVFLRNHIYTGEGRIFLFRMEGAGLIIYTITDTILISLTQLLV